MTNLRLTGKAPEQANLRIKRAAILVCMALGFATNERLVFGEVARQAPQAKVASSSADATSRNKKGILILKSLFAKELKDSNELKSVFPPEWIENPEAAQSEIQRIENELIEIRSTKDKTVDTIKEELLILQLQWLKLPLTEKKQLLSELRAKEMSIETEQSGNRLVEEASREAADSTKVEQQIKKKVEKSTDEREANLLKRRLELEKIKQDLLTQKKELGEKQKQFSDFVQKWGETETEIKQGLDGKGSLASFREKLRTELSASNTRVVSRERFFSDYLGNLSQFEFLPLDEVSIVRDGDSETVKDLIQDIHRKSINLNTMARLLEVEISNVKTKLVNWEKDYRDRILDLRGKLIARVKAQPSNDSEKTEPILRELRTILSATIFWFWSFRDLYWGAKQSQRGLLGSIEDYAHLLRLFLLVLVSVWILVKRKQVVNRLGSWIRKRFVGRARYWSDLLSQLVDDLYTFLVLLFLGTLAIDFGAGMGFSFLYSFKPFLNSLLVFFFLWGLVDFVSPLMSQRRFRFDQSAAEVRAMEELFEFFPKIVLVLYLIESLLTHLLFSFLNNNFFIDVLSSVLGWVFFFVLYFGVWYKKDSWRLVARKATDSQNWARLLDKVQGKIYEPFILIFGGGLGVYLLAWKVIKARIGELEVAKSFQAMVSRALLERIKKVSTTRVDREQFPDGYLKSFSYQTRALPEWHVERSEPMGRLKQALESWVDGQEGTTVLVTGDRGIGKSELIYQFFRLENVEAKETRLRPGDTTIDQVCETLSKQILGEDFSKDVESFEKSISDLEPSVIFIENLENSILRQIDGFQAFSFLIDLVMQNSGKHLWIMTFTPYAWTIAKRAVSGADCFSHYIYLSGMTEKELQQMIMARHQAMTSLSLDFSELSLGDDRSTRKKGLSESEQEQLFRLT